MNQPPRRPKSDDIEVFWSAVRGGTKRRKPISSEIYVMPTTVPIVEWTVSLDKSALFVVPGSLPQDRSVLLQQYAGGEWKKFHSGVILDTDPSHAWLEEGLLANVTQRIARLPVPPESKEVLPAKFPPIAGYWELLWGLVTIREFIVEEPLRGMVDQEFYLLHDGYKAIWEARFLAKETSFDETSGFIETYLRWIANETLSEKDKGRLSHARINRTVNSEQERIDMLLLLLTLATQNGLIDRIVITLDGLEEALRPEGRPLLKQLYTWIESLDRWIHIGNCPLGLVVGFSGSKSDLSLLKRFHPKLFVRIQKELAGAK